MPKDVMVGTRVEPDTYNKLEKISKVKKWSISKVIREILEEYTNVA